MLSKYNIVGSTIPVNGIIAAVTYGNEPIGNIWLNDLDFSYKKPADTKLQKDAPN